MRVCDHPYSPLYPADEAEPDTRHHLRFIFLFSLLSTLPLFLPPCAGAGSLAGGTIITITGSDLMGKNQAGKYHNVFSNTTTLFMRNKKSDADLAVHEVPATISTPHYG